MLADALKAYDKKVAAGEAKPPPQPTAPTLEPPSLAGLHVSAPSGGISQSLPSGNHFGNMPKKPRPRPSLPTISQLPILELPEPSPHSCSLLDEHPMQHKSMLGQPETGAEPMDDDVGGTCVECPSPVPLTALFFRQRPLALSSGCGCSLNFVPSPTLLPPSHMGRVPAGRCWNRRPHPHGESAATCMQRRHPRRCCGGRRPCIGTRTPWPNEAPPHAHPVPSLALPGLRSLRGMPTLSSSGAPIRPSALCSADWEATPWVAEPRRRLYSRPCPLATSARLSRAGIAPLYPWQRPRSRCGGRRPRRRESWHGHSFRGRAFYLFGV